MPVWIWVERRVNFSPGYLTHSFGFDLFFSPLQVDLFFFSFGLNNKEEPKGSKIFISREDGLQSFCKDICCGKTKTTQGCQAQPGHSRCSLCRSTWAWWHSLVVPIWWHLLWKHHTGDKFPGAVLILELYPWAILGFIFCYNLLAFRKTWIWEASVQGWMGRLDFPFCELGWNLRDFGKKKSCSNKAKLP